MGYIVVHSIKCIKRWNEQKVECVLLAAFMMPEERREEEGHIISHDEWKRKGRHLMGGKWVILQYM
jgi:hypothetical protein